MGIDDQTYPDGVFGKAARSIVGGSTMLSSILDSLGS